LSPTNVELTHFDSYVNVKSRFRQFTKVDILTPMVVINRYYDPTTDQFLSVDPKVAQTDQPYVFAGDSPLNATDPLGLSISGTNGESCISLSACSNPSVQARNQGIWSAAATAAFWAGVKAYQAIQRVAQQDAASNGTHWSASQSAGSPPAIGAPPSTESYMGNGGPGAPTQQQATQISDSCQIAYGISRDGTVFSAWAGAGSGGIAGVGAGVGWVGEATSTAMAVTTGAAIESAGIAILVGGMILTGLFLIGWASSGVACN
jgi:RHS repeat-associated protein